MPTCKEVVKIVSSGDQISWRQGVGVRVHLLICHYCKRYVKHLEYIRSGVRNLFEVKEKDGNSEEIERIEREVLQKIK